MEEKPTGAFMLSLIGGVFVLLGGLVLEALGTVIAIFTYGDSFVLWMFAFFGIAIIIGALMIDSYPSYARVWGVAILIQGIISLIGIVTAFGGLLSIIGGALAMAWNPSRRNALPVA